MSTLRTDTLQNGDSDPVNFVLGPTIGNPPAQIVKEFFSVTTGVVPPVTSQEGAYWWDSVKKKLRVLCNGVWRDQAIQLAAGYYGERGFLSAGYQQSGQAHIIRYVTIATTGNTQTFGSLADLGISGRTVPASNEYETSSVAGVGATKVFISATIYNGGGGAFFVFTAATPSNASGFGNNGYPGANYYFAASTGDQYRGSASNGIIGLFVGGMYSISALMQSVSLITTNTVVQFGNLTAARGRAHGAANLDGRAVFGGAQYSNTGPVSTYDYVELSTAANASNFGSSYTYGGQYQNSTKATSNDTRMLVWGGSSNQVATKIAAVEIGTLGNAVLYGSCTSMNNTAIFANATRCVCCKDQTNGLQYVSMVTSGNASAFGALSGANSNLMSGSSAN